MVIDAKLHQAALIKGHLTYSINLHSLIIVEGLTLNKVIEHF